MKNCRRCTGKILVHQSTGVAVALDVLNWRMMDSQRNGIEVLRYIQGPHGRYVRFYSIRLVSSQPRLGGQAENTRQLPELP
jgi:hypothetical protein